MLIKNNSTVLFQGDSITDAGRDEEKLEGLGRGYAMMAAGLFSASHPGLCVNFINKGISGNRVRDLKERWNQDCLNLKPDLVSIMIGINDCWRRYDSNEITPVDKFEEDYRFVLTQTKKALKCSLILIEPFVLPTPPDRIKWREDLDPKIAVVRMLAREFKAHLLPLDGIFQKVSVYQKPEYWAHDGVHPTLTGHALIAKEWLKLVCLCGLTA